MTLSLQEVSDRLELQELVIDYATAIDEQDYSALDKIFTEDAYIDYTAMGGIEGDLPSIKQFLRQAMPVFPAYQHLNANQKVVIDGDTATGKVMCLNPMVVPTAEGEQVMFLGLWYIDEYRRTEQGWRISRRAERKSFSHNVPREMAGV
ncbi:SnoaL-like protein [Sinobacterium caligoides]|uniref:SnoaL-like protein n=1 Tax=Sinobacterium caligoides TaxID=933926 RepID=A0A3N2DZB2_9GAMM|nr:nuclear transport factor 2 family protein [Sinobacterium caligoides]ROS04635.1 SnoaL-like protein [Sinobacterium caligoides]